MAGSGDNQADHVSPSGVATPSGAAAARVKPVAPGPGGSRLRPRGLGVATRLTLLFSLVGFVVVVVFGAVSLRDEREDLLRAVEQQLRLLGEVVHISVENALRDEQAQDVTQILRAMESVDPGVSIFVVDASGRVRAASWAGRGLDAAERAVVASTEPDGEAVYRVSRSERGQVALVALPLATVAGGTGWSVLLTRELADVEEDLRRTSRRTWMTALSLLLLMVISGVGIGHVYIRRPLARLMGALDDVRDGGLRRKIEPLREDEFAQVADSFNRMARALDEAWSERDRQSDALRDLQLRLSSASRLAAVGQVSAGLAHEIGSPLQVIEGRARMLERRADDPDETRRLAAILVSQTQRIGRIVQRLLDYARAPARSAVEVDVASVVRDILELLEPTARRRRIRISLDGPPSLRAVCDPDVVQQVVLNLVGNALQALSAGGRVRVSVALVPWPATEGHGGRRALRVVVEDDGPGMDADMRERLFEPFFTTRADAGGVGLGLPVVRTLVLEAHGTIAVDSEPGRGARFTVELPEPDPTGVAGPSPDTGGVAPAQEEP